MPEGGGERCLMPERGGERCLMPERGYDEPNASNQQPYYVDISSSTGMRLTPQRGKENVPRGSNVGSNTKFLNSVSAIQCKSSWEERSTCIIKK